MDGVVRRKRYRQFIEPQNGVDCKDKLEDDCQGFSRTIGWWEITETAR